MIFSVSFVISYWLSLLNRRAVDIADMCGPNISDLLVFIQALCMFLLSCTFYMWVCAFPLFPFHSDLDCPVPWGSSGLLPFSCFSRYLFLYLSPSTVCLLCHYTWPQIQWILLCSYAQTPTFTHIFASTDNTVTVWIYFYTLTVDPCAHWTIRETQESIRSQLLCNWGRY